MTNIELPRDAEGRYIPMYSLILYDKNGKELSVDRIEFDPAVQEWNFVVQKGSSKNPFYCRPCEVYLKKPADSWGMLLDDLNNAEMGGDEAACCYMRRETLDPTLQCEGCKLANNTDKECSYLAYGDIAARIRKLRGED